MGDFMQGDPDKNPITVPFSDDVEEDKKAVDLVEDEPKDASPEERVTRKRKRQERLQTLLQEGQKNADRVRELEERDERRERELAELRGMVIQQQHRAAAPPADGKDSFDRDLDAIYARQSEAYRAAQAEIKAGTFDDKRQAHYERVAREIETDKSRVLIRREMAQREPVQRQEQARQIWEQKYPEVYANPRAYQFAEATFKRRSALLEPGQPITNDLVDEVMTEAMTQFRLGPKKPPSATERSRLSGVPSSGAGGGGSPGIQMTPVLRRMAVAARDDLPEEEAIKAWVNKTGKRLREKKAL